MKTAAIVLVILVAASLFAAGCTGTRSGGQESAQGTLRAHYDYTEGWWFTQGCYGKVSGYVYNTGNLPVESVQLDFNLVNSRTGTIRDSRPVYIGTLGAGESRSYEAILDGECIEQYHVEAIFGK